MANVSLTVTDAKGSKAGTVSAPEEYFGISHDEITKRIPLIHQVVVAQLDAARQGTHAVKNHHSVSGTGRKPWKQKGTGRARQGSLRGPQFKGGAVVFGPVNRDYSQHTPKKMKSAALRFVLSDRANAGRIHVIDGLPTDKPSTKAAIAALSPVVANRFTTVVLSRNDVNAWLSVRNIPTVHVEFADQLNTYDVISAQDVVFTKESLQDFLDSRSAKASVAAKEA
jgi:large subunit ribosomal protein L4